MTFEKYIDDLKRYNPSLFAAKRITITVASLESQLARAYQAGERAGNEYHANLKNLCGGTNEPGLFESLFRK